ncbi:MAG: PAS domain S-box protein [Rhodocyclales bacterium]|nr:PAS domain S-box protein [Rhodocyclales bacterium]
MTAPPARPAEELLHELQVHQIELEMQNEKLRESEAAREAERARYLDLYDLAPVGHCTVSAQGRRILQANLTAASLLGLARGAPVKQPFPRFILEDDQDIYYLFHRQLAGSDGPQSCELRMLKNDGTQFWAHLTATAAQEDGVPVLRIVLSDIGERKRIELALSRSEESFRRLAQISPAAILRIDVQGQCIYANLRCAEGTGRPVEELLGDGWLRVMYPEDRDRVLAEWRRDMSARQPKPLEWRVLRPDGTVRWVLSEATVELDERGKPVGYISCISDITELRDRDEQRRVELAAQRDTLVREVHHRIKNNLQSVAGLLQRELGKFVELDPQLETAISQVHAIAVVHGLQSAGPDEAIRLCDSVSNICKTVSDLSQRPVLFDIEHEQTTFRPVRIDSDEAIPVALVLNELILNSVKHSPEGGRDPTVSLSADGISARIVIRNALSAAPDFNIDTGQGLGTGLRLVRSLLPDQGAQLIYESDAEGFMLTTLKMTSPVVVATHPKEAA